MKNFIKKYTSEIIGSMLCLFLGILSGHLSKAGDSLWYTHLIKPWFNPPSFLFGPVWTVLYIMMGIALGKIWNEKTQNKLLLFLFVTQFVLNLLWSPLFFYFQRIDFALLDIWVLWLNLALFLIRAWEKRIIFVLFLPYVLWVSFAVILNFSIYKLNAL